MPAAAGCSVRGPNAVDTHSPWHPLHLCVVCVCVCACVCVCVSPRVPGARAVEASVAQRVERQREEREGWFAGEARVARGEGEPQEAVPGEVQAQLAQLWARYGPPRAPLGIGGCGWAGSERRGEMDE